MNKILLHKATHKNFMSYGNNINEFDFPDGLLWLSADNGSGKSTEIEVINFAFYGDSYRGGNRNDLRNTLNVDGIMEVTVEFTRINDEVTEDYRITRSVDPKGKMRFDVERMEDGAWVLLNKRAGYVQKDFEENILCVDEVLFKNFICVNTQESIPFIDMPAQDRRKITESIAMISMDKWKKENGKRSSSAHSDFDIASSDMNRLNTEIAELDKIIAKMKEEKEANIQLLETTLANKQVEQSNQQEKVDKLRDEITAKYKLLTEMSTYIKTESTIDAYIEALNKANTALGVLDKYKTNMADANAKYNAAVSEYNALEPATLDANLAAANTKYQEACNKIYSINNEINKVSYSIDNNLKQMKQIEEKGTSIEAQPSAFKVGEPCPTCGKLYTENDIEAHMKAEQARIDALKEGWRKEYKRLRAENTTLTGTKDNFAKQLADAEAEKTACADVVSECAAKVDAARQFYANTVSPAKGEFDSAARNVAFAERDIEFAGVDIEQFEAERTRLMGEKAKIADTRTKYDSLNAEYNAENAAYSNENGILTSIGYEVSRLSAEITKAKEAAASDALATAESRRQTAYEEYCVAENRMHSASDTIAICDTIAKLCSDDGMKKMVFSLFIPAFNASVQKNIIRTGLPFTITFDETMSYTFTSAPGYAPSYVMLSQGQRRKIGFAITMAFRDFVSLVGNFSINFLSLDEVLDISTDNNAMRDMLDIVKDMVPEIGCVMVVTHRGDVVADKFDNKLTVEYDGTYSRLGEVVKL